MTRKRDTRLEGHRMRYNWMEMYLGWDVGFTLLAGRGKLRSIANHILCKYLVVPHPSAHHIIRTIYGSNKVSRVVSEVDLIGSIAIILGLDSDSFRSH